MMAREQEQFLDVTDRDTAARRWWAVVRPEALGPETVSLAEALGRVLCDAMLSAVDVPGFDRSNVDGYSVRAEDTFRASEDAPGRLRLNPEEIAPGVVPVVAIAPGTASPIATGGMLPRGADAVLMVEHARIVGDGLALIR